MAQTPVSGTTAFASPQQMTARYDWRTLARLLSDADTPLTTQTLVENSSILLALLRASSGDVEMACANKGRYTVADLQVLVGTNAGEGLADLVACLTLWRCYRRRPNRDAAMPPDVEHAYATLAQLEHGDRIWPLQETEDAGVLDDVIDTESDIANANGIVVQAQRFFGTRSDRLRGGN